MRLKVVVAACAVLLAAATAASAHTLDAPGLTQLMHDETASCSRVNRHIVNCYTESCGETSCSTSFFRFRLRGARLYLHDGDPRLPFTYRLFRPVGYTDVARGDDVLTIAVEYVPSNGGFVAHRVVGAEGTLSTRCKDGTSDSSDVELERRHLSSSRVARFAGARSVRSGNSVETSRVRGSLIGSRLTGWYSARSDYDTGPCVSGRRHFAVRVRVPPRFLR